MKTGHQIIEEALTEAAKLDPMNSPISLDGGPWSCISDGACCRVSSCSGNDTRPGQEGLTNKG